MDFNPEKKLPTERALIAVGVPPGSACFLAFAGQHLKGYTEEFSWNPVDLFDLRQLPPEVGIYYLEVEPYWHNENAWDEPPCWIIEFKVKECKKAESKELDTLLGLF